MELASAKISSARIVAFDVLRRVDGGGYASDLLLSGSAKLASRDAGLASEIVFGCLRYQKQLDYLIDQLTRSRPLDLEVRLALRMGVYQLRYLDRIPPHAAVGESVELTKRAGKKWAGGLVNAVLRKVNRQPIHWPDRATELSCPEWLLTRWDQQFGPEAAAAIARAALQAPETYIASTGRVQDIGSQAIVPMLNLQPGQSFLDLCAAPGNKTAQALETGVEAIACDLHWHRLKQLADLQCRRVVLDGTEPLPFSRQFDRILVDAPCSGTGTLGRNPEIKWRLHPYDLIDLQIRQTALLRNALAHLKPDGTLVYATCSLETEENERVIESVPLPQPHARWRTERRLPGVDLGDGFFSAVLTSD
ncbi:MAG: transcription antitermination factor NusB [Bryobacteraceae bacterium]